MSISIWILEEMEADEFKTKMNAVLPPDMKIKQCQVIPNNAASTNESG